MKTIKELQNLDIMPDSKYIVWYEDAIEWILEDIQNSSSISVESIEKYLQDLLK